MATMTLLILSVVCLCAHALAHSVVFPQKYDIPVGRNTIFGDEKLEGEIFEDLDSYNEIAALNDDVNPYRLPLTTKPSHYNVLWAIDTTNLNFSGDVQITIQSTQVNISEIVIHAHDLNILTLSLQLSTTNIPVTYVLEPEHHFLRVRLTDSVLSFNSTTPILYTLSITFSAALRDDMYGIYKSWFRNVYTDNVSWMATTQFQATAARFAFPCYDEPSFKATFAITIRRPAAANSWSCMRISDSRNSTFQGLEEDVFHTTPIMSTYLLALIVAEYKTLEVRNDDGEIMYEVIGRPSAIESGQGDYAFEVGQELLAEMSNHTDYDFYSQDPNIKMTQASIPDFGAGAMENWGLLTYREAYLMYNETHTNGYFKQLIAYILSHEIAHMWFGNLVTCDWWDVLWLNEGFARYYQYFLTHWVEDYMGLETRFIIEQMHTSLLSDSVNNPQPLTNPGIGSPASVSSMFSTITYNKGAAVIRMTEHLMGTEIHRTGLRNYLRQSAFQTATPQVLFDALDAAGRSANAFSQYGSDFSLSDYYKSWTEQPGHPVLNVQVNHQTGEMLVYQRRFNINTGYSTINTNYIVPITFSTASNPNFSDTKPSHVIRKAVTSINRGSVGDEWVIFNRQQTGFYRVNYDDYTWNLIVIALRGPNRTLIHEYNRAQIVNDVFSFARAGLMSYSRAFNILSFLEFETEYAPWVAAATGFSWIRNRLAGTTYLTQLDSMIARWGTTVMGRISYYPQANETFMQSYLRWQLAPVMCNVNVALCRDAALEQFRALTVNGTEVPVDSRNWVYCNGLRQGTEADFTFLWNRFERHEVYTEKIQLLMVLGCTPHQTSLNTFLNGIVGDNFLIRQQDYTTAFNSAVTGNEANTQIVFQYIQNNLPNVITAFGSATLPLSYISSRLRTVDQINAFQTWATNNQANLGAQYQAVFNGAETSRESIAWASAVQNDMNDYFVSGNENIVVSTPATITTQAPVVTPVPNLVEPSTPALADIPDSAFTNFASILLIAVAVTAPFLL